MSEWPPNPFVYDRPLPPEEIIDRERELALMLGLADSGQTARLSGPRRFGKTTLLRRLLADAAKRGMDTVYVDLDRVVSLEGASERIEAAYRRQLQGPVRRTAANVIQTLRPRIGAGAGGVRGEIAPAIEHDARRVLERMLDLPIDIYKKHGRRTLVVFDEFQDILRIGSEVEGLIRSHIQHQAVEAAYVFAGSHPGLMLALFSDRERPLFGQARPIQLTPLDDGSLGDYIEARFDQSGRSAGEALDSLLALVRGHPQRAMLVAHHLWEATPRGATADLDTFAAALDAVDRELREAFERTWERLRTNEARVLAALAASNESLFAQRTLGHFGLSKSGAEQGRDKLIEYGEVQRLEDGGLVIVDPLLERWVRETQSQARD
jgi:uncharacterized protein